MLRPEQLPTFEALMPEPDAVKTFGHDNVDLRLSCSRLHQDGAAFNPETTTTVVCDVMGGHGPDGEIKNNFGHALAHAAATLENIHDLQNPTVASETIDLAKRTLEYRGIPLELPADGGFIGDAHYGMNVKKAADSVILSTLVAVQRVPGQPNDWRIATFGDSSVVVLDEEGLVDEGWGEAIQLILAGYYYAEMIDQPDGGQKPDVRTMQARSEPIVSELGVDLGPGGVNIVRYSLPGHSYKAEFVNHSLPRGYTLALASDAYVQKSTFGQLEHDVSMTNSEWAAAKPYYRDDTTLAVIRG